MPVHSHGDVSHDHPDSAPGHTHDTDAVQAAPTAPTTETAPTAPVAGAPVATAPSAAAVATTGFVVRALLTVAGAAAIIGGAFLAWARAGEQFVTGTETPIEIFWAATGLQEAGFASSAGLVVIVIGLIALVGLALPTGWLTRLAGALAIIAFVLFLITLYRVEAFELGVGNIGLGMWLVLVGGILAVLGGFFGARPRPVAAV